MSTIDQLKRIDSACVAFERGWNHSSPLTERTLLQLADEHAVDRPEELLIELLLLDWQQTKEVDPTFCPNLSQATWKNYSNAFNEALLEFQSRESLARRLPALPEVRPLVAGTLLGPYRIGARIGAGGMGDVYSAEDTRLGRTVAIKILARHLTQNPVYVKRFAREAATVARLSHPNIVTLFDLGEAELVGQRVAFVVMEFLEGETLREQIEQDRIPVQRAIQIAIEIADALEAAHLRTVIHRDIKPENVFLTADGRVKILDFGLARLGEDVALEHDLDSSATALTQVGAVLGTSGYMAPEQVRGEAASPASDLFSLTCVLYEMLLGQRAFQGVSRADVASATLRDDPLHPANGLACSHLPPALLELLQLGLNKEIQQRIESAHDYSRRLAVIATDLANEQFVRSVDAHSTGYPMLTHAPFASWLKHSGISVATLVLAVIASVISFGLDGLIVPRPTAPQTIVVLPFSSKSDLDAGTTAHSLTLALTDTLARDELFCVRPYSAVSTLTRESTFSLFDDPRLQKLKADKLVTGQVTMESSTVHVRVELVEVAQGRLIWSHNYSMPRLAIASLHDAIQSDIVKQLGGKQLNMLDCSTLASGR